MTIESLSNFLGSVHFSKPPLSIKNSSKMFKKFGNYYGTPFPSNCVKICLGGEEE